MNDHRAFTGIFRCLANDPRITVWHFSIYMSMVHKWLGNGLNNPIAISRKEVMAQTHIGSIVTYHKCVRQLKDFGYIIYEPSYNPFTGSTVYLLITETQQ